ncbi:Tyrosine recombinase XerC [Chryseobacterium fistulae]|uniref:Tyrosine recombinase XerC n=2 Tax=Chryseobacterium fistulae TaxID=2675058 RepID=A0A6N4XNA5_9FLAO|nr:Tyrosine recombinase XerC [Chryseobacterium fistulae]
MPKCSQLFCEMKNFEVRVYSPENITERWYVYIYDPTNRKIINKIYKGINNKVDLNERRLYCEAYKIDLERRLKSGWVPIKIKTHKTEKKLFCEALDFALDKKKSVLAPKSYHDYSCTINFFKSSILYLKFSNLTIFECQRVHIKSILDHLQLTRNWTAKNYNKHLGYIKSIFSELVEWELIEFNPVRDIRSQKEEKKESNITLTDQEHQKVFEFLKDKNYNFYVYCSFIYYCGIRPYELTQIRCKYIDLNRNLIFLPAEITKNENDSYVPILGNLKELIRDFNFSNPNFFLFGTYRKRGGKHKKEKWFSPNPYSIKRDTATKLWNTLIKKELGINKNLYSLKHKGADDKIKAGMDLKTVKEIFRHSDEKITEIYAKAIKIKRFEEASKISLPKF